MAEQEGAGRYWCHMCAVAVRPAEGEPEMKCPHCHSGFLEEMETARSAAAAEANTTAPFRRRPITSGRNPCGSRTANILSAVRNRSE